MRPVIMFVILGLLSLLVTCNNVVSAALTEPTLWIDVIRFEADSEVFHWIYLKEVNEQKNEQSGVEKEILMKIEEGTLEKMNIETHTVTSGISGALSWQEGLQHIHAFLTERQGENYRIVFCPSHRNFPTLKPFLKEFLLNAFAGFDLNYVPLFDDNIYDFFDTAKLHIYDWYIIGKMKAGAEENEGKLALYAENVSKNLANELNAIDQKIKGVQDFKALTENKKEAILKEESFFQIVAEGGFLCADDLNRLGKENAAKIAPVAI